MRVLVISHTYITPINRKKWQVLASMFPDAQLQVLIPTTWPTTIFNHVVESDLSLSNSDGCRFIASVVSRAGNEVLYSYSPIKLLNLIRNFRPDIVHVEQGDNALSYFQAILLSKIACIKTKFVFFTWVNWVHKFSFKYRIFWKWVELFNLKMTTAAIVGNSDAESVLRGKNFNQPMLILPQLGVDSEIFKPAIKQKRKNVKIGFVGRLVEEKGIFLLLQAFAKLAMENDNLRLCFLGRGPCEDVLWREISRFGLDDKVEIAAPISHEKVAEFMQDLDIFVLPSFDTHDWREQFGHVLIEAMACKIAVIGSDAGEIPNIISDVGLVFKQKNVDSLKLALGRLVSDDGYRQYLAELGYRKVEKKYSCAVIAEQTYQFWNSTLKKENICE